MAKRKEPFGPDQLVTHEAFWLFILIFIVSWLTPLAFAPVPWPDDSAFYLVARDLFSWPPRWVMRSQAPFEPSYAQFNFNTMPLFPLLLGFGRWLGVDGSFGLKFWPLLGWFASGLLLARIARQKTLTALGWFGVLGFALDPILRWGSIIVRPESWVMACGMALVWGFARGWPRRLRPGVWWDPTAALLSVAAALHFNAVHLVPIAALGLSLQAHCWRELARLQARTAGLTVLYLSPWWTQILLRPRVFADQFRVQWDRLAVPSPWSSGIEALIHGLQPDMGSPLPWPLETGLLSIAIVGALFWAMATLVVSGVRAARTRQVPRNRTLLLLASTWLLSAFWLAFSKPEVWFVFFVHGAFWLFLVAVGRGFADAPKQLMLARLFPITLALTVTCASASARHAFQLARDPGDSWHWSQYQKWIACIDRTLMREMRSPKSKHAQIWAPIWPDILVELKRLHPDWEFTRTVDFSSRWGLAIEHGQQVDAVVVTESLQPAIGEVDAPWAQSQDAHSIWLEWKDYYLAQMMQVPGFAPRRHLCRVGRWQAFLLLQR